MFCGGGIYGIRFGEELLVLMLRGFSCYFGGVV